MRIAVASDGVDVSSSFETGAAYTFYTVDQGKITDCQNLPNPSVSMNELVDTLKQFDVCAAVAHSFNGELTALLKAADIEAYATETVSPREATDEYLYAFLICPINLFDDESEHLS